MTRPIAALASAVFTIAAYAVLTAPVSHAQCVPPLCSTTTTTTTSSTTTTLPPPQWDGSKWTRPSADGQTVADGTFSGTFVYAVTEPSIEQTELTIAYSAADTHPAACGDGKQDLTQQAPTTTTSTPSPPPTSTPESSTMDFLFEVAFVCNGLYDVTATATAGVDSHEMPLKSLHIAVPPPSPLSLNVTDNGNQSVTLTWEHPKNAPVDTTGYRLSKRTSTSQTFTPIADTGVDATTFTESGYPSGGGSFVYEVETLRSSPDGTLTSDPVVTDGALTVNGTGKPGSGGSVGGKAKPVDPSTVGPGSRIFDSQTTLPGDEGEEGAGDPRAASAGDGTVQRFSESDGAGLIKPFATALDLGVWAGLLMFLTRRAAREERELSAVELEHPT